MDVHPSWLQVLLKKSNLLLHTPVEVLADECRVLRLPHNGHLRLVLRPVTPIGEILPLLEEPKGPSGPTAKPAARQVSRANVECAAFSAVYQAAKGSKFAADKGRITYYAKVADCALLCAVLADAPAVAHRSRTRCRSTLCLPSRPRNPPTTQKCRRWSSDHSK